MNEKYEAYLNSKEWIDLKVDLLQTRGCKCQACGKSKSPNKLQIHHKTYERIFNELPSDLIILCAKCHMKQHKDIIPKQTLIKFGIKKPKKKKAVKVKKKKKFKIRSPNKKELTAYQKALMHFVKN